MLFVIASVAGCSNRDAMDANYTPYPDVRAEYVLPARGRTVDGRRACNIGRRCSSESVLPPETCSQPMPTYYQNITEPEIEKGILLIHPYTRTKVLCLDYVGYGALQCAENYKQNGFVLVTDIPQFVAKYDNLSAGTYPSRKWRNGGELNPRF